MNARMTMLCALALGIAMLAAGCGGDDGDVTTSSLDKTAWVAKVNKVCDTDTKKMAKSLLRRGSEATSPQTTPESLVQETVPAALRNLAEKIRAFGAPSGDEAQVEAYLASLERSIGVVEARRPGDFFELQESLVGVNRAAGAAGLEECEY